MSKKEHEQLTADGFLFTSEAEAARAKKELEGVKYIRSKMDMEQPGQVLQLYNRMIVEKMFSTAVGIAYLKDLQEYLITIGFVQREEIRPIPVPHPSADERIREVQQKEKQKRMRLKKSVVTDKILQKRYRVSLAANMILVICVVLMFVISATSNHPNILNYETELINRYSAWEQELSEREEALRKLENQ